MSHAENYYEILAISRTASSAEIKAAWKKLAKLYHPDLVGDVEPSMRQFSEAKFKQINEAYRVLSNPATRNAYDQRWVKVEEPAATAQTHSSHHASRQRSTRHHAAPPRRTSRDKAKGVLIAMGVALCWAVAYLVITSGSPRSAQRTLLARTAKVFSDIADRAAKRGCADADTCRPYKIVAFREKMESNDGHSGLFMVQSPEGPFTAYCEDGLSGGCSKFAAALGKTIWLDDNAGRVCYTLDKDPWVDAQGQRHKGHMQCLKVVSLRKIPTAPAVWYKILAYDAHYRSKDGHTGSFLLESKNETLTAYCDSSGSLLDENTNPCLSLMDAVGEKVSFNPAVDDEDFICFDRQSRWHLDEHGEYHLDNRECLKVIERKYARYGFGRPDSGPPLPDQPRHR